MNTLDYKKYRVLLVDDEVGNLGNLLFAFELTFDIVTAASGAEALEIMEREMFAVIISDQRMPTMTGTELLSRVKENYPQTVRILITAYTDIEAAVAAINSGDVYRYIGKEQPIDEIEAYIRQAIDYYHVKIENERLYEELNEGSLQTITALAKTLDARDPYTFG
ncbi:MAG: response regulator, partial [Desulfobulbaceae bacterium]|nr:response regulator [Desulfobulbaceae bacterium]